MNYKKTNNTGSVNLSAGDDKIKYYDCSENNCIFEIIPEDECDNSSKEGTVEVVEENFEEDTKEKYSKKKDIISGKIVVKTLLDCGKQEVLEGVKVNLYKINGLSPILVESNVTDSEGKTVFSNIEEGNYRVIEVVNKKYFEKPKYINWNEITIDDLNTTNSIIVINRLKSQYIKNIYN